MGYIPIFLEVGGKPCIVVGGGEVAQRKVRALLEARATVTVVSPALSAELAAMARRGTIRHLARSYQRGDLRGFVLAYAATDDGAVSRQLAVEADELGIPINVADVPELCTFVAPSVIRQGDLQIAVSTSGASPAMARRIREELEPMFGAEYALALEILRAARSWLQAAEPDPAARARKLSALAASRRLLECLRRGDYSSADAALAEHLGPAMTLEALGLDLARSSPAPRRRAGDSRQEP
ncbi:MAG: bifunctional precorrin-2 dehydrogenase/sirohydrochlorin ferrochelatase [Candidatus Binataceae bacterium]